MGRMRRAIVAGIALYAGVIVLAILLSRGKSHRLDTNELGEGQHRVDHLVRWERGADWQLGTLDGLQRDGEALALSAGGRDAAVYPATGVWTGPEFARDEPSMEVLPSFNAALPPDGGLRFEMRARVGGAWTPWLYFGSWGRTPAGDGRTTSCSDGRVKIDTLLLERASEALQARVWLFAYGGGSPRLRRVAVAYSGEGRALSVAGAGGGSAPATVLRVPFFAQHDAPESMRHEICSPASVTMVMSYWGVDRGLVENARAIYDPEYAIFGNWMRAVQRAGELGLAGWVTRFRNWEQVRPLIAQGQPVIASIRYKEGEFSSAVTSSSDGHLLVIRGFTAAGDVVVNDPASRTRGEGAVYRADELGRAWFGHGGVAYIIRRETTP